MNKAYPTYTKLSATFAANKRKAVAYLTNRTQYTPQQINIEFIYADSVWGWVENGGSFVVSFEQSKAVGVDWL